MMNLRPVAVMFGFINVIIEVLVLFEHLSNYQIIKKIANNFLYSKIEANSLVDIVCKVSPSDCPV